MILITLVPAILFLTQFYVLCKWITILCNFLWITARITITFYQIARLQYCFSAQQIHSHKYGYSKRWFIFLYVVGAIFWLFYVIYSFLKIFVSKYYYDPDTWTPCTSDRLNANFWFYGVLCYYLWDWTVFGCYIVKICQFYRKNDDIEVAIWMRIKFVVYKISFLTLIIEVSAAVVMVLWNEIWYYKMHWILRSVVMSFNISDYFISMYMVFLMIDNNNAEYIQFVKKLNKIGMFCCCKSFVDVAMTMDGEENDEEQEVRKMTMDTRTIDPMPEPIAVRTRTIETETVEC